MKSIKKFLLIIIVSLLLIFLGMFTSKVQAAENQFSYLSDIAYIKEESSVAWGSITLDKNLETKYNDGLITLLIDGQKTQFLKGISAHATSTVVYDIADYNYDYFTAYIGVDESRGANGNGVKFYIYTSIDGENWDLKTSETPRVLKGNNDAVFVKIDIKGAKYLKLYCNNNGNESSDHAVYADAKLIKEDYVEQKKEPVDFIKTVEEYDEIIKKYDGKELSGEYELVLLQREFVKNFGYDLLQLYGQLNEENKETLSWLFNNVENLRLYILGGKPTGPYMESMKVLNNLYHTYKDDFEIKEVSKYGTVKGELYKKMAITLSLTHSSTVALWMQPSAPENQSNAVTRYAIFKKMYDEGNFVVNENIDITKWFESYNIEEMRFVLNNIIDDEEILWLNEYTKKCIDEHPNQAWTYLTPHPYMAYVWPNYGRAEFHDPARKDYWDEKFNGIFSKYGVTYSTPGNMVYKVWMNFRNEFGTGAVCGGISKTGSNIRTVHGIPAAVIGQPGHAAIIYYAQDDKGNGYWNIDNDVSGWTLSEKGERMLLGWGNATYSRGYSVVYMALAQEVLNDYENFEKCEKLVILANSYEGDLEKQEEIYRKALEVQPINIDAWYGLISVYNASETKTEDEYFELAKEVAENLKYFPLPMQHLTNLIKPKLTSIENSYRFTLLQTRILTEASVVPNNTEEKYYVYQPSLTRLEAKYLLGNLDKTIATFSFDGEDAEKIVLSSRFDGNGIRWDYSLDGKQTWKEIFFTADEEHKIQLTKEEINSITSENDIYVHIVGVNYEEENLYKIDINESAGLPATLYANDLENRLIAAIPAMQWKYKEEDEWTSYSTAEPDLTGNKTVIVRVGATETYLASNNSETYTFTEDIIPENRKYIPVSHLSIHNVSTEATAQGRYAQNAIDANIKTNWHSAWNGSDKEKYITIKLDEPKNLTALEYFPIAGGNGKIESAQILVSMDGENWIEVVQGTDWKYENTNDVSIKNVEFEAIKAMYIKIVGKKTQAASASSSFIAVGMFNLYEDTTAKIAATFSFDGNNGKKIVLEDGYKGLNWKYSLDSGTTWKDGNGEIYELASEEINQINENDKIKIRFDGDEKEYILNIKEGDIPEDTAYLNDWENRLIGLNNVDQLEWKLEEDSGWTSYSEQEPIVSGNRKLLIRTKATGIKTASKSLEYQFTEDNYKDTAKYIPISHLSIEGFSTQSTDSKRPYYATNAIDGNINTQWHTDFKLSIEETGAYITIKLDEPKYISALEYIHMSNDIEKYGYMKNGKVYVSTDNENWTETGKIEECANDDELKRITFNESIYGQYVKLEIESHDIFATAAIINLYEDITKKENPVDPKEPKFEVNLVSSKEVLNPGEIFEISFEITNLQNIEEGLIAIAGQLEFSKEDLEILNITGENEWNIDSNSFNEQNLKFVTEEGKYFNQTGTIYKIQMKVKENIEAPKDITFKVKKIEASNGEIDVKSEDKELQLRVEKTKVEEPAKITSEKYKIEDGMIFRILPETTFKEFKESITCNKEITITNKDGNSLKDNEIIKTDMLLKADTLEFKLVVIGDINQDGKISITDIAKLKLHYIEQEIVTGSRLKAADVNNDGKISITDIALLKLILVGSEKLK